MFTKKLKSIFIWLVLAVLAVSLGLLSGPRPAPALAAQSINDSLPTRTSTPKVVPTAAPQSTQTPTIAPLVWAGRLVSNTPGYTKGGGSIFRVYVTGVSGTPIELRSDDELIKADSGSKPEFGPYAAEFAPVTAGTWNISVPALGVSLPLVADGYNFAVIEFLQVPATQTAQTEASPTPSTGQVWEGKLVEEKWGQGGPFARVLIRVAGLSGQPVRLSTLDSVINTAATGQKPDELGPDVVEFAGLTPGRYILEPVGLRARFDVELKANTETWVEFTPQVIPPTPTLTTTPYPTFTPAPPTATASPTITPTPSDTPTPTLTPVPTPTDTPLPSPTPVTRWLGAVASRFKGSTDPASISVRVFGIEGLPVRLSAAGAGTTGERRCITGQEAAEADLCTFEAVLPGRYVLSPEGLGLSLPVTVEASEKESVVFDLEVLPPGVTGWQARTLKNSSGFQAAPGAASTIMVRLTGRPGQVVALHSARGAEQTCEVRPNPLLGGLGCEFGQLLPGVYRVEALHTGANLRLFMDGAGAAEVEFSPSATYATLALAQLPPVAGHGMQPYLPTVTPAPVTFTPTPAAVVVRPNPTQTPTPTPTITPTPTPTFAWQGRIVQTQEGVVGTIGVRAAGLKDHPVMIRSGPWQSQLQLTGTKPELGEYATEFGGLATGEYIIELVDLAEMRVTLGPGQFMLVEFRYDFVNPPGN